MTVTTDKASVRTKDINGFMQVTGNPISKIGVYPYLGSEIPDHDLSPNEVFNVYRPAEELEKEETLASFRLMPFIDNHEILGDNATAPERKGIQGYIGEQVYFDTPYLRGNIMIPSRAAQSAIEAGKIELSPAYRCKYEKSAGVFNGESYQFIQRDIRANHLALVDEGRTGPDVAVLDHRTITLDTKRLTIMEFTEEQLAQIKALIAELLAANNTTDAEEEKTVDVEPEAADEDVVVAETDADEVLAVAEEAVVAIEEAAQALEAVQEAAEELADAPTVDSKDKLKAAKTRLKVAQDAVTVVMAKRKPSMDSLRSEIASVRKQLAKPAGTKVVSMDTMVQAIADRDELVKNVSQFIGSFDSSRMTADSVTEYANKKIGLKGGRVALDAWLHGRKPESSRVVAQDSKSAGDNIDTLWSAK